MTCKAKTYLVVGASEVAAVLGATSLVSVPVAAVTDGVPGAVAGTLVPSVTPGVEASGVGLGAISVVTAVVMPVAVQGSVTVTVTAFTDNVSIIDFVIQCMAVRTYLYRW